MQATPNQPNQEQLAAIISFAQDNGRNWKAELNHSWMNANYAGRTDGHLLQQVRNQFGPSWLVKFKLKAAKAAQSAQGSK
jgi:hypothetical protein